MDSYKILGVSRNATDEEIKKAYRDLLRKWHPDANPGNEQMATKETQNITRAYTEITEERKRTTARRDESKKDSNFWKESTRNNTNNTAKNNSNYWEESTRNNTNNSTKNNSNYQEESTRNNTNNSTKNNSNYQEESTRNNTNNSTKNNSFFDDFFSDFINNERYQDYERRKEDLKSKKSTLEEQQVKNQHALGSIEADICHYSRLQQNYRWTIKLNLDHLINVTKNYYSSLINSNNAKFIHRIMDKKRMDKQKEILTEEEKVLSELNRLKKEINTFIETEKDENIFTIQIKESIIPLISSISNKDFKLFLNAIKTYQTDYETIYEKLNTAKENKIEMDKQIIVLENKIQFIIAELNEIKKAQNSWQYYGFGR